LHQVKSFCTAKGKIPTECRGVWEKIFISSSSGRGLVPRIYKEHGKNQTKKEQIM
jgi:hypothetical protein